MAPMQRNRRRKVSPPENHHLKSDSKAMQPPLFAVIMDETAIVEHKLRIPAKSAMIFGAKLSDLATLTLPNCNRPWEVRLKKDGENVIWLVDDRGEFFQYYSIHLGSILQFIYRGNSVFSVRICDALGSEIKYPFYGPKFEEDNDDRSVEILDSKTPSFRGWLVKQEEDTAIDDHNVEILDLKTPISHGSSKRKAMNGCLEQESFEKSTQNVFNSQKRGKRGKQGKNAGSMNYSGLSRFWYQTRSVSSIKEEQEEVEELGNANISGSFKPIKTKGNANVSGRSKPKEANNKSRSSDLPVKLEQDVEMILPRTLTLGLSKRAAMSKETEKAVHAAFMHKLQNPSFMAIFKPYGGTLDVPAEFVKKHMRWCSEMIQLQCGNEKKKWPVRCYFVFRNDSSSVKRMSRGWGPFSSSKNLQKGDVCVFELISKVKGIVLRVWIYRAADYAECPQKCVKAKVLKFNSSLLLNVLTPGVQQWLLA